MSLRIQLFGDMRLTSEFGEIRVSRVVQSLLAYLVVERHRMHTREALTDMFWSELEPSRGRACLSTALWRLKTALEGIGISPARYLTTTPQGSIGFSNADDVSLDVANFESAVRPLLAKAVANMEAAEADQLTIGLSLYRSEFLHGFYADWALRERERLRRLFLNGQAHLMHYHRRQGHLQESLESALSILAQDSLREEIHREAMRLYADLGQRSLAVRHYEELRQLLLHEMGIEPMEETRDLYERLAGTSMIGKTGDGRAPLPEGPIVMGQLWQDLLGAIQAVHEAHGRLAHAVSGFDAYLRSHGVVRSQAGQ